MKRLHRLRAQRGFTLVELLVVMTILSILSMGGYYLLSNFLSSQLKVQNQHVLYDESADINAYLFEKGYSMSAYDIATNPLNPGSIRSVSVAGDQLSWCYTLANNGDRWCTRIFYVARWRRLYQVTAPEQAYVHILPVRGPNQTLPPWGTCEAPCFLAPPGSPLADPVLDKLNKGRPGANQLAANVSLSEANVVSATITNANAPFKYFDGGKQRLDFIPPQADSSTSPVSMSQLGAIEEVQFDFYLQPPSTEPWAAVSPLHYLYVFSV